MYCMTGTVCRLPDTDHHSSAPNYLPYGEKKLSTPSIPDNVRKLTRRWNHPHKSYFSLPRPLHKVVSNWSTSTKHPNTDTAVPQSKQKTVSQQLNIHMCMCLMMTAKRRYGQPTLAAISGRESTMLVHYLANRFRRRSHDRLVL